MSEAFSGPRRKDERHEEAAKGAHKLKGHAHNKEKILPFQILASHNVAKVLSSNKTEFG
ncbi:hypothetical protein SLEP1_g30659 [Rubroshorea leprosula]|uniref:Uncharacterized protein n=1 Tax=Rubroshorea leprosula TaxID=152421 RepID=A0AAV5K0V9_9ROSI|nr:hypothetical protein SLEP1_g30659 [Rubroshorea leprosula]